MAFVDLDAAVEAEAGRPVAEVFESDGEAGFRALESEALARVLATSVPTVVSTGGGAVLAAPNRELLGRVARTVWLRAEVGELIERLRRSRVDRPLLRGDLSASVVALDTARRSLYAEVADLAVDVDGLDRAEVVHSVLASLDGAAGAAGAPR